MASPQRMTAQSGDKAAAQSNGSQAPFQLKAESNLVVVRVVVRDANGKPVAGLQKEDFKLLDRGKEQSISQFEVETSSSPSPNPATIPTPEKAAPSIKESPDKFLALYFDTFNTSDQDMIYVREAAERYLAANVHARDRVAIFTSEKMLSDFTNDPQQIHNAVNNLKTSARSMLRVHDCPDLSDYQALQISQQENPESDAWQMALNEARTLCHIQASNGDSGDAGDGPLTDVKPTTTRPQSSPDNVLYSIIRSAARNVVLQSELQARANLQGLKRAVDYIARMPGERTVILVSPGFLSESEKYPLDEVIDRALRSQVIISSLDPRGLALLLRAADASQKWIPGNPGTADRLDTQRELVAQDVLAEVAQDTGGTFFHNNNDLQGGLGVLAGSPVDYVLAFAPNDLKDDGKFHSLKVKLAEKHDGYSAQARRGYFAPRSEAEAAAEATRQAVFEAEAKEEEQIRDAMFSKNMSQQLHVGLGGKLSDSQNGMRELSLVSHLDAKELRFEKDGEHNANTVTFVFAIFDPQDNLVTARLRRAHLNVADAQLESLRKDGVSVNMRFQLKPGTYRIREVVTDSEEHHMTAVSTTLKVP
jgi:VWFA-related protein